MELKVKYVCRSLRFPHANLAAYETNILAGNWVNIVLGLKTEVRDGKAG